MKTKQNKNQIKTPNQPQTQTLSFCTCIFRKQRCSFRLRICGCCVCVGHAAAVAVPSRPARQCAGSLGSSDCVPICVPVPVPVPVYVSVFVSLSVPPGPGTAAPARLSSARLRTRPRGDPVGSQPRCFLPALPQHGSAARSLLWAGWCLFNLENDALNRSV